MAMSLSQREWVKDEVMKWIWPRPLPFDEFIDLFGKEDYVELIDGAAVERAMVQLQHEKLLTWLLVLLKVYADRKQLGIVLGSRTPVKIATYRGRLPDLLFVR